MTDYTHYVYCHKDPKTDEIKYVGIGQYDRAWCVRTNQRKKNHVEWIKSFFVDGFTLNDIVEIKHNLLSKKDALRLEQELIEKHRPAFNELRNPDHWNRGRTYDKQSAEFVKTLHEMGYGYIRIAYLVGGDVGKHMTIKRMIANA